ncbi:hypothetical protein AX16_009139 [Volvariella volvacea WC 439]|nr:hypothetical protein AX16_009139 [Volvariella volvacea WC 439]
MMVLLVNCLPPYATFSLTDPFLVIRNTNPRSHQALISIASRVSSLDITINVPPEQSHSPEQRRRTLSSQFGLLHQLHLTLSSSLLTSLSISCLNSTFGHHTRFNLQDLFFPRLKKLELTNYVFMHTWQFEWIKMHKDTLEVLKLVDASISWRITCLGYEEVIELDIDGQGFIRNDIQTRRWSRQSQQGTGTGFGVGSNLRSPPPVIEHNFQDRWTQYFRSLRTEFTTLMRFDFGTNSIPELFHSRWGVNANFGFGDNFPNTDDEKQFILGIYPWMYTSYDYHNDRFSASSTTTDGIEGKATRYWLEDATSFSKLQRKLAKRRGEGWMIDNSDQDSDSDDEEPRNEIERLFFERFRRPRMTASSSRSRPISSITVTTSTLPPTPPPSQPTTPPIPADLEPHLELQQLQHHRQQHEHEHEQGQPAYGPSGYPYQYPNSSPYHSPSPPFQLPREIQRSETLAQLQQSTSEIHFNIGIFKFSLKPPTNNTITINPLFILPLLLYLLSKTPLLLAVAAAILVHSIYFNN